MVDEVLESQFFPVNDRGEIILTRGKGSSVKSGYLPSSFIPVNKESLAVPVVYLEEETIGGWVFIQDGVYTSSNKLTITNGAKHKIRFDLSNLAYTTGSKLTLNYDDVNDKFLPQVALSTYLVTFRARFIPTSNSGTIAITAEAPTFTFNPLVGSVVTFDQQGVENFLSVTQTLFVDSSIIPLGVEIFIKPVGGNIQIFDYSIMVQRTYVP